MNDKNIASNKPGRRSVDRLKIDGWVIIDKSSLMTSTQAVSRVKRIFRAAKAGHAGTLDPLASGVLPIALGEATKTVPYVQDGSKEYSFALEWGKQTDTDDSQGATTAESVKRPSIKDILTIIPNFIGRISQTPPVYSALHINGERAYALARQGIYPDIPARVVTVYDLRLISTAGNSGIFELECGKGTYVRAIARELGQVLGCFAHVTALRRTRVGPFSIFKSVSIGNLENDSQNLPNALQKVDVALSSLKKIDVSDEDRALIKSGRAILYYDIVSQNNEPAFAAHNHIPVAVGHLKNGQFIPSRVFNL